MAVSIPKLPKGWVAQMAGHRDIDNICYEFRRVYDEKNVLHQDRSYWLITPIGDSGDVNTGVRATQAISYQEYLDRHGTLDFTGFSSPTVPVEELAGWLSGHVAAAHH
jgi:hypothetical protein